MLLVRRSGGALGLRRRAMGTVQKGTARAAVHGSRSPTNTAVEGREEVEEAIERGKEEKQKARERVEAEVDAKIGSSPAPAHGKSDK